MLIIFGHVFHIVTVEL